MNITEKEYKEALSIVEQYHQQMKDLLFKIKSKSAVEYNGRIIEKTERLHDLDISMRLLNRLYSYFSPGDHCPTIADLENLHFNEFASTKGVGWHTQMELIELYHTLGIYPKGKMIILRS